MQVYVWFLLIALYSGSALVKTNKANAIDINETLQTVWRTLVSFYRLNNGGRDPPGRPLCSLYYIKILYTIFAVSIVR